MNLEGTVFDILTNIADAVLIMQLDSGKILYKNECFSSLLDEKVRINRNYFRDYFLELDDYAALINELKKGLELKKNVLVPMVELVDLEGQTQRVLLKCAYYDKEKEIVYLILNSKVLDEYFHFKRLVDNLPEPIALFSFDEEYPLLYANLAFYYNFGIDGKTDNNKIKSIRAILSQDLTGYSRFEMQMKAREKASLEFEYEDKEGQKRFCELDAFSHFQLGKTNKQIYCTFKFIDVHNENNQFLMGNKGILDTIKNLYDDVIFHVDLKTLRMELTAIGQDGVRKDLLLDHFPQSVLDANYIYEEDIEVFSEITELMLKGVEEKRNIRITFDSTEPEWHTLSYMVKCDKKGEPIDIYGKLENIQEHKELETKASVDELTGCLNKATFKNEITKYIQGDGVSGQHALLMIDIDNFKGINDNLGHFFGDTVLEEISDVIHLLFRRSDFIGRIGGDEFAVFIKNYPNINFLEAKAKSLIDNLRKSYQGYGENIVHQISASIGICKYPEHANSYDDLYKNADLALYSAKDTGKNNFKTYSIGTKQIKKNKATPFDRGSSEALATIDYTLIKNIFTLLFESKEIHISIDRALQLIGVRLDVDRTYVFDRNVIADYFSNTNEWCAAGIQPEIATLQQVPEEYFDYMVSQANEDGVYACSDTSLITDERVKYFIERQGIQSFVFIFVHKNNKLLYSIGLDECKYKRVWSHNEIASMLFLTKIISLFMSYKKKEKELEMMVGDHLNVINELNLYAYMIEYDTHKITYYSQETKKAVPDLMVGEYCYQALRGNSCECEDCPLKQMRKTGKNKGRAVVKDSIFGANILTMASVITKKSGIKEVFVACSEISDYVENNNLNEDMNVNDETRISK